MVVCVIQILKRRQARYNFQAEYHVVRYLQHLQLILPSTEISVMKLFEKSTYSRSEMFSNPETCFKKFLLRFKCVSDWWKYRPLHEHKAQFTILIETAQVGTLSTCSMVKLSAVK
ncbi:Hypothetical_protein [Hexamita inflata]|uniref:Hypothetical_protein n=1 Tax=Hexamita inflata TaxID=28002 RepID=A0AA86VR93_9EUKA|nr:Hypothetical protein HINF_LOCUS21813 [Hexamita inflata]CAI9974278.1 Hypothetical protein HINF_LOCUS61923 [Hexamita inflata]